jgi:enediyne biosynthesis protein E4
MKKHLLLLLCSAILSSLFGQGGFIKITDSTNPITQLSTNARYRGSAWVDLNNDGLVDLFAAPNAVFLNKGGGRFEAKNPQITVTAPNISGCSFADYDNDGKLDLLLTDPTNRLFLGNGDGSFREISNQIANNTGNLSWACAFGDINNDARMDAIFVHPAGFLGFPSQPNKLYKQTTTGSLQPIVSNYAVTNDTFSYTIPFWSDYDLDGDMDLFVSAGPAGRLGPDFCYQNLFKETGKDSFSRLTQPLFAAEQQDGQTYNFVDIDNDGDLDLCLTNYNGAPTRLYRRQANGSFTRDTTPFTNAVRRLDNAWADFDNDGDLDVIMTADQGVPIEYYENDGTGKFKAVTNTDITTGSRCSGATIGDYDNDGDLDVFVHGITTQAGVKTFGLYQSTYSINGNKWVNFRCVGKQSNRAAIGTKVRVKARIGGVAKWQMREILAQNTFQGHNDLRVHVGLKEATQIDSVEVTWLSGRKDVFANLAVNNFYRLTEGEQIVVTTGIEETQNLEKLVKIYPNPVQDQLKIEIDKTLILKSDIEIFDVAGRLLLRQQNHQTTFQTYLLPNGVYYLRLYATQGLVMKKFIKQ